MKILDGLPTYGARDLRLETRKVMDSIMFGGHVVISRHGNPEGVLVPAEWYQRACAALEALDNGDGE